jgi:hypothetical protein
MAGFPALNFNYLFLLSINFPPGKGLRSLVHPEEEQEKGRRRTLLRSLEDYSRRIGDGFIRKVLITLPG